MAKIYAAATSKKSAREEYNMFLTRKIASHGMVLLENKGLLPLRGVKTIAAFGSGVRHTIKGGTGSGDVNSRVVINVEHGLEEAGLTVTTESWLDRYDVIVEQTMKAERKHRADILATGGRMALIRYLFSQTHIMPMVPRIKDEDLENKADAAIYVVSRNSGEGSDRHPVPGDYVLNETEKQNIRALAEAYGHITVILNVGGVMDTKFLRETPGVDAVLLMSQPGNISGLALADVLLGKETPSGHLTATWAENYFDYPSANTFSYMDGDTEDEYYYEGIYVGYRYFDTFNVTPAYPFGYGLSYTEFSVPDVSVRVTGNDVLVRASIKNIGDTYFGREAIQVYCSAPKGEIPKPYQELVGFAKTRDIAPGEAETVRISFKISDMASYCEKCASWVLEPGKYYIRVGTNSRNTHIAAVIEVPERKVISVLKNKAVCDTKFRELEPNCTPFTYKGEKQEKEQAPVYTADLSGLETETVIYGDAPAEMTTDKDWTITLEDVMDGRAELSELVAQLTVEELADLCIGSARGTADGNSTIGSQSVAIPGAAGDTTSNLIESRKIPNMVFADGPAGLRLQKHFVADSKGNVIGGSSEDVLGGFAGAGVPGKSERPEDAVDYYQYCTAVPIATMLAQTWDLQKVEAAGDIAGGEMEEFNVSLWLAPGMNIQRNPLCGRNFEYYSEDPLLAGKCAAADTKGVQQHKGHGTCIKHFALNNSEENRQACNVHASERAVREIYLRAFEIAVRESQPLSLMTSYNLVNGTHSANNHDLVTSILRDEWGFRGLVMTDWGTTGDIYGGDPDDGRKYAPSDPAACIKAGNDLMMPGSKADYESVLKSVGAKPGEVPCPITKAELQLSALRILKVIMECELAKQ